MASRAVENRSPRRYDRLPEIERQADIRILLAVEDEFRTYREVIAASVKLLRPHVEVLSTDLEGLEQEASRFDPQLIISSQAKTMIYSPPIAWIKIPSRDPMEPTEVWVGEDRWKAAESKLEIVAEVIDRTEEKLASTAEGDREGKLVSVESPKGAT